VGGEEEAVKPLEPVFLSLAPKGGYLHVGGPGAGHYVKMVHNGIEYGLMQAYAEGFEILHASSYGLDLAAISELWMQGSVVRSWLLELAGRAFRANGQDLTHLQGYVEDSGEGRWTVQEAIDHDVPAPIITLSLLTRFRSRQTDSYGAKVLAALRNEFGGHAVRSEKRRRTEDHTHGHDQASPRSEAEPRDAIGRSSSGEGSGAGRGAPRSAHPGAPRAASEGHAAHDARAPAGARGQASGETAPAGERAPRGPAAFARAGPVDRRALRGDGRPRAPQGHPGPVP